ncbi:GNAT family N-acetyltransferase [Lactobacillus sp. ESL0791]|uniref:GNAT family N-acetyltransferase n=1 Tax=Lactobacillus sp. ESL0791 TaxID=2983234 RepID=UPI0023F76AD8|nr:GNAT family N-acetyltransferase [Lactobacillus sp. ESL0791]MDF7639340.1 GNAT family N-acetyltransferase [Lactobacillus sp. ESL0791]
MAVYTRLAKSEDLPAIMKIIAQAKELLKQDGSPQWQDGQPNAEMFTEDIRLKRAYVLVVDEQVAGVATLMTTPEPSYQEIQGAWNNAVAPYATIHRIAISAIYRGRNLAAIFISTLLSRGYELGLRNFRIDTHALNKRMQSVIRKAGYSYRGIIYVNPTKDGARYAYELNLE